MPKSLFDAELTVTDGYLHVTGKYVPDADADANGYGYGQDGDEDEGVIVYWLVAQDDIVARGVAIPEGDTWGGDDEKRRDWQLGEAKAVALQAGITPKGTETYTWWMKVKLVSG
jgi:hypothetical protein